MAAAAPAATVPPSTDAAVDQGAGVNRVTAASARTTAARSSTSRVLHSPGSSTRRDNPTRVEPAAMARTSGVSVRTEATSAAYPAATSSGQPSKPVQNAARVSASNPLLTPFAASSTQVSTPMPVTAYDASRSRSRSSRPRPTSTGTAIASRSPSRPVRAPALHRGHQEDSGDHRALRRHATRDPGPLGPEGDAAAERDQEPARERERRPGGELVEAEQARGVAGTQVEHQQRGNQRPQRLRRAAQALAREVGGGAADGRRETEHQGRLDREREHLPGHGEEQAHRDEDEDTTEPEQDHRHRPPAQTGACGRCRLRTRRLWHRREVRRGVLDGRRDRCREGVEACGTALVAGCRRSCSTRSSAVSIARHRRVASGPVRASPHAVHTASGETCPRQSGHAVGSLSRLIRGPCGTASACVGWGSWIHGRARPGAWDRLGDSTHLSRATQRAKAWASARSCHSARRSVLSRPWPAVPRRTGRRRWRPGAGRRSAGDGGSRSPRGRSAPSPARASRAPRSTAPSARS